ncbi:MAG: PP2C family serine/threonine-protein phosphatase [Dehalococcoidia bacterium]
MNVRYAAISEPGMRRTENQDSVLAVGASERFLFAVADGVGGLADGADASKTAIRTLEQSFKDGAKGEYSESQLVADLSSANARIVEARNPETAKLSGSTIVTLLLQPEDQSFVVAHVGDSRAYLVRNRKIEPLTGDHSLVADQVRAGILTKEEAAASHNRHVITRSLGINLELEVEVQARRAAEKGDTFLLCSDGLTDVVTDDEIESLLAAMTSERDCARALVDLANERGGPDNISVVLVHVVGV